jgi:hypothetical protein
MTDHQAPRQPGQPEPHPTPITEPTVAHLRSCASGRRRDPGALRPRHAANDRASRRGVSLRVCASARLRIRASAPSGRRAAGAVDDARIHAPDASARSIGGRP